jgi:dual specificity tyrosine-phosphorylation-regulated kinase 2/3/4
MHKHSDTSLRSSRNQLPTIAGSPSVATAAESSNGGFKEPSLPPPSSLNVSTSLPRETPTKIPRMAGQSGIPSPTLKGSVSSVSTVTARRTSLNSSSLAPSAAPSINNVSPSPGTGTTKEDGALDEFGVLSSTGDTTTAKNVAATPTHRLSVRASPSMTSTSSRVPRQVSAPVAAASTRKNRESLSFAGLRKASTSSVTSLSSAAAQSDAPSQTQSHSRFSALSPSKGLKLLTPKISLSGNRHNSTNSSSSTAVAGSAASSRQSLSTPSPVPSSVDDEEQQGDDEMLQCVRRQQAKKLSSGATQEELDEMFKIPEPLPPVKPTTPAGMFR